MYKTPINSIQTNLSMLITANNDVDKMVDSSGGPLWLGGLKREKHSSHQRYSVLFTVFRLLRPFPVPPTPPYGP